MTSRALWLSAILSLALAVAGCIPAPSAKIFHTENDFYYIPPQNTASVYIPGDDIN